MNTAFFYGKKRKTVDEPRPSTSAQDFEQFSSDVDEIIESEIEDGDDSYLDKDYVLSENSGEPSEPESSSDNDDEEVEIQDSVNSRGYSNTTVNKQWHEVRKVQINIPTYSRDIQLLPQTDTDNPFELYSLFVNDDVVDFIVLETNRYARSEVNNIQSENRKGLTWKDVDNNEIRKFFGILLIMGVVNLPEIRLYWSKKEMYSNLQIKKAMSRDRFLQILQFLHFCNNDMADTADRLFKCRGILDKLNAAFESVLIPGSEIVIDESMVPWRGRLSFRQYIPNKTHKYGVKLYKVCLPEGYTYRVNIYSGRNEQAPQGKRHASLICMNLLQGLLDEGRILYADNFYTSIELATDLLSRQTFLVGTIRSNSKGLPDEVMKKKLKKGEVMAQENEKGIKIVKWLDKRQVNMISTLEAHTCTLQEGRKRNKFGELIRKPDVVYSYNFAKKGVDLSDQMSSYYSNLRKSIKWYKKVVFELLFGTALVNAWVIHKKFSTNSKFTLLQFREEIINKLLGEVPPLLPKQTSKKTAIHTLKKFEGQVRNTRRRCRECYKKISAANGKKEADAKTKKVSTYCNNCEGQPPLCLDCFNAVHAK